jgi:hypothetical protein
MQSPRGYPPLRPQRTQSFLPPTHPSFSGMEADAVIDPAAPWPPAACGPWPLRATAQAVAVEVAAHAAVNPDAPRVLRATAASDKATATLVGLQEAAPGRIDSDVLKGRDVAAAVLALQGVDWEDRVTQALLRINAQADEFDDQLSYAQANGTLPVDVLRVAVEQLLDAIGVITVATHSLLRQCEEEMAKWNNVFPATLAKLKKELQRLHAAAGTVRRWNLTVPEELLLVSDHALRVIPLAATDTATAAATNGETVQRVIGALLVRGGARALKHIAWVDFDDKGNPVFLRDAGGVQIVTRPTGDALDGVCAELDVALKIYDERVTLATSSIVPLVLGDVAAYARARVAALAERGADAALEELSQLCAQVPQACGPREDDVERDAEARLPSSVMMARATALARLADKEAPPPSTLEYAVHKQLRAAAASKQLYALITALVKLVGPDLVVLPGGVKKLPRTIFKFALAYMCDMTKISDFVRCTVVCESLADVTAVLKALLASDDVSVVRVKNRFAPDYDAKPAGGYIDLQMIVLFQCGVGEWMLGEVQVNLWSMLRIKESPYGGHAVFNLARSLRAYDEATYTYSGKFDAGVAARVAAGALLEFDVGKGGCKTEADQIALARALASNTCRVATVSLGDTCIGDPGVSALAEALKTNVTITTLDLSYNVIGDAGAQALASGLKGRNSVVAKLNLFGNSIGDLGAAALADALATNTSITTIYLANNKIGDVGALAIARALHENITLNAMYLAGNAIGDSGAKTLAAALNENSAVSTIVLFGNKKIGPDGKLALSEVKPPSRVRIS